MPNRDEEKYRVRAALYRLLLDEEAGAASALGAKNSACSSHRRLCTRAARAISQNELKQGRTDEKRQQTAAAIGESAHCAQRS